MTEHVLSLTRALREGRAWVQRGACSCGMPLEARSGTCAGTARKNLTKAYHRHLDELMLSSH